MNKAELKAWFAQNIDNNPKHRALIDEALKPAEPSRLHEKLSASIRGQGKI